MSSQVQTLFSRTTLGEVLACRSASAPSQLITVNNEASMQVCLNAMIANNVSAVPVLDAQGRAVGIVDMVDVCRVLVEELSEVQDWKSWPSIKFSELLAITPVTKAVDFNRGEPLLVARAEAPVESIMKFLSSGLVHRCLVHVKEGVEYGIISQTDICSWLSSKIEEDPELQREFSNISLMGEMRNRSSESHKVVQALWSDSVYDILKILVKEDVRAVGLVDGKGKLQANFSANDLIQLDAALVSDIRLSGMEFLQKYSGSSLPPLALLQDQSTTLADAVMIFTAMGLHRVWLVDSPIDSRFSPVGVVTLSDVLKVTSQHFSSMH